LAQGATVWIGDGGNFPGQQHFRRALDRYLPKHARDLRRAAGRLALFIEHKFYEPAFYSTVNQRLGTSYYCAQRTWPKAFCLVDLGHHAPNVNIEMIVRRLIHSVNWRVSISTDSKYGDDDLDSGSIKPFQLFLIFNELVDAELTTCRTSVRRTCSISPTNVTDPIESLMLSAGELVRALCAAHVCGGTGGWPPARREVRCTDGAGDMKQAFRTDVSPILAIARERAVGRLIQLPRFAPSCYRRKSHGTSAKHGAVAPGSF